MKYAFMSFSCPGLTWDEMLAVAKKYGYDGIEPRIDGGHKHGLEPGTSLQSLKEARKKAEDMEIAVCCIATSCKLAEPRTAAEQVELAKHCIELASDMGAPVIRVFGGKFSEEVTREKAIETLSASLSSLADFAGQHNVTVCLETHDSWCNPDHVAQVMKRVNHPAVAVNWDVMHPVRACGWTMEQAFTTLKPWIRHVHFHDGSTVMDKLEMKPMGTGDLDHRSAVQLLKKDGYQGFLSGEWINWEPYEVHLPRELAAMRGYEL